MKSLTVVLAVLLLASLTYGEDVLIPAKYAAKVCSLQISYQGVQASLKALRADSTNIAGTISKMQGGKLVPILWPDRIVYQKAGDVQGAKATLDQYQAMLKAYCQQIASVNAQAEGFIKEVQMLTGGKDKEKAIKCLEAK